MDDHYSALQKEIRSQPRRAGSAAQAEKTARRLFIGVPVDDTVRNACGSAVAALRARGIAARFVDPVRYHVTLAFLGNVPAARLPAMTALVARLARETASFEIPVERVAGFPSDRRARVVWAGPRARVAAFDALSARARAALMRVGYRLAPDEFPHVTLARMRDVPLAVPTDVPFRPVALRAETLVLYESLVEQTGPRYAVVAREFFTTP